MAGELTFEEAAPDSSTDQGLSFEDARPSEGFFKDLFAKTAGKPFTDSNVDIEAPPTAFEPQIPPSFGGATQPFVQIPELHPKSLPGQIAAAPVNVASRFVQGLESPLGLLTAGALPFAPAPIQGIAGAGFGLPAIVEGAKRVYRGTALMEPQEAIEGALETLTGGVITGGAAHQLSSLIAPSAPILPKAAAEAVQTLTEGVPDATKEGIVQESSQPEHPGDETRGAPTGPSSRSGLESAAPVEEKAPLPLTPENVPQTLTPEVSTSLFPVKETVKETGRGTIQPLSAEDLDWENKTSAWSPVSTAEASDPAALSAKIEGSDAGRTSGAKVSETRRLIALTDPQTGQVHVVSAYKGPKGMMAVDPAPVKGARGVNRPLSDIVKRFNPIYTMLRKEPVQDFKQSYGSLDDFFQQFGTEAREKSLGAAYEAPEVATEQGKLTLAQPAPETPVDPREVVEHMAKYPSLAKAREAFTTAADKDRLQRGLLEHIDNIKAANPDLTPEEAVNTALDQLYEQSRELRKSRPRTGAPSKAGVAQGTPEKLPQAPAGQEVAPKLSNEEGARLQALTDKLEKGEKLTAAEQKRYRSLRDKSTGLTFEEASPSGFSIGPGAASWGDVPAAPRQAIAAGAKVEQAPPENKPIPGMSVTGSRIRQAVNYLNSTAKGIAGHTLPRITLADRLSGEAGARYLSSRIAARPLARTFAARVLQDTNVDPMKLGAALTEDNLRSIREEYRRQQTEAVAKMDYVAAQKAKAAADGVKSMIGAKNFPFNTEDEYFDFLETPEAKKAIAQHIQLWREVIDPQYRVARDLDPDVELPFRGQQTGARINLKAILPDELGAVKPIRTGPGSPSLTGTFKRRSPFAITAKGSGEAYDINYPEIIANTFEKQLEIANKNAFDNQLVKSGNAVIDHPGQEIMIGDKRAVAFPLTRKTLVTTEGKSYPMARSIYVRDSLADEYRTASNVNERPRFPVLTLVNRALNKVAISGLTDITVHLSNLMTALFNRPVSGKLLTDTLLSATGRADIPITLFKAASKAFKDNEAQIAELSEIGAMRAPHAKPFGIGKGKSFGSAIIEKMDRTTRLVLDDTYKSLAKQGLVENTETARREFVNQVGQYNRRAQGWITRSLRDTGLGPFVTAGKTFNALGVRMATLDPGVPASSNLAAAALRTNVLSKWIGAYVLRSFLNHWLTGNVGGRPGTPFGNIDFGTNDKIGRQQSFPLFGLIGLGRAMHVTGVGGALQAKRLGLTNADAFDAASRDIFNSWTGPAAGPAVRAGFIAASGYPPAIDVGRASRRNVPGESQKKLNFLEAAAEMNPVIKADVMLMRGAPFSEALRSQFPRFALTPGPSERMVKDYPKIVQAAQANAFTEDMIHQARKMPVADRRAFVNEEIKRLPPASREKARDEVERRRVYRP